jgi:transcription elongation GreA/GreB family factor
LQTLPAALGPRWTERALLLMQERHARMVSQIPKVFAETGQEAELHTALERSIREHSATSETLFWLCKERNETWDDLISPDLLAAILGALERDQHNENARGSRLRDLLLDDRELIPEMFRHAETDVARDSMRRLMLTPVFDDLTKRSLLARIIKLYPELGAMITGAQPEEKSEALVVSWSSLHKRKAEYEDLIKKKIPENTKEIALARSYGDLSENFEFKAAKQMQAVLMRRKTELEQMLLNARGTAFQSPDTSRVSIGTIVTLRDADSETEETYTILGAWDGDPDRRIISYQTAIAQALMGHSLGEIVTLNTDQDSGRFAIVSIAAAPIDETPPEPATEVLVEEVAVEQL